MWKRLAKFVLQNRLLLLILLFAATAIMALFASKIKLSYEFSKAIPVDNPKYQDYLSFKEKFGDDGNVLVVGVQTDQFFELKNFEAFRKLSDELKKVPHVEDVLSVSNAVDLLKDTISEKLNAVQIFPAKLSTQEQIDSSKAVFYSLPFYKSLLYNPATNAFLLVVRINKEVLNSKARTQVINDIVARINSYTAATGIQAHISGLLN
jgi:hypothetical protein